MNGTLRFAGFDATRLLGLRSVWWVVALGLAIHTAISAAMAAVLVGIRSDQGLDYAAGDIAAFVVGREPLLGLLGAILAVIVVGQDYRHSSRPGMALLAGSRRAFVAGKLLVVCATSLTLAVLGVAVSAGILQISGLVPHLCAADQLVIASTRVAAVVMAAAYTSCVVMAFRSQTVGLAAMLAMPFAVESGVGLAVKQLGEGWWQAIPARLPYASLDAFVPVGVDSSAPGMFAAPGVTPGVAAVCALCYLTLGVAAATRRA